MPVAAAATHAYARSPAGKTDRRGKDGYRRGEDGVRFALEVQFGALGRTSRDTARTREVVGGRSHMQFRCGHFRDTRRSEVAGGAERF